MNKCIKNAMIVAASFILLGACSGSGSHFKVVEDCQKAFETSGLPNHVQKVDEQEEHELFLCLDEEATDSSNSVHSIWISDKNKQFIKEILSTDTIPFFDELSTAKFLPLSDEKILIEGIANMNRVVSLIKNIATDEVILLSCNAGLIGFTPGDGYLVMGSLCYYDDPKVYGKYDCIDIFDQSGRLIKSLDLKDEYLKKHK